MQQWETYSNEWESLDKKWSFPLRISSVNMTKSRGNYDLVTFIKEILNGKLYILCVIISFSFTQFWSFVGTRNKLQHSRNFLNNFFAYLSSFMLIRNMYYCEKQFLTAFSHISWILKQSGANFKFFESSSIALSHILWVLEQSETCKNYCVKNVQIGSFFLSVFSCIQSEYRKIRTGKNSVFGHFSRSEHCSISTFVHYYMLHTIINILFL